MANVSLRNLRKRFAATDAVADFSLEIAEGELMTFLGPSGCGKTTTLRMIAGFIEPTSGSIHIGDTDVTRLPVHKRGTGMVFQRYALFPHMTVTENVAFGLEMHKVAAAEKTARIREVLEMVRMHQLGERYPRELSGGQQQRVAIARALAIRPRVFLLDEPLSNLDAKLRIDVREEIHALQRRLGLTTIFVTHDQEEALGISDRMAIMHDGKVQQVGTPQQLYEQPANLFVADFLGRMNFFTGRPSGSQGFLCDNGASLAIDAVAENTRRIGIRPERVRIATAPEPSSLNRLAGAIETFSYLGDKIDLRLKLDSGESIASQMPNAGFHGAELQELQPGRRAYAIFHPHDCVTFDQ